ncbi:dynein axonemal assembly factor 11-like isoform X2 [Sycon ciliatum]|uniref:dynein axonemal assembly factor 11-like isoform X2 n=1 Tax=Sycon ciliatum TaxID=27933 RepID=UPI0031F60EBC
MSRITEEMIRKRSEHNNLEIFTLEEVSLHQQDITHIELLDKMCRDLKILYLQSNLIGKIENVQRLKKLEYLNLALNNVKLIENLAGCESLNKLDLTVNFISELTCVESLKDNYNLRELFLTGNPCSRFEGYRQFVIATLPQLKTLDGQDVEISERIQAQQEMALGLRERIVELQTECAEQQAEDEDDEDDEEDEELLPGETEADKEKRYWEKKTAYTPKSRIATQAHLRKTHADKDNPEKDKKRKVTTRVFERGGRMLNINDGKYDFSVDDSTEPDKVILDLVLPRFMDLSLIDCDIQPTYVRVTAKEKVFQLVLQEEIQPDKSDAKRSKVTGHLVLTMPKVRPVLKMSSQRTAVAAAAAKSKRQADSTGQTPPQIQRLEVDTSKRVDIANIVSERQLANSNTSTKLTQRPARKPLLQDLTTRSGITEIEDDNTTMADHQDVSSKGDGRASGGSDDSDFEDDPDVPPLM